MNDKRFPASEAHRLDHPSRREWLPPAQVLSALSLSPEDSIADMGAGTGYFTLPLAQAVGAASKVYAIDAQHEMLVLLRQKLVDNSLSNVELIHAEGESTTLPADCCDLAFLANVWHEFTDRSIVLEESCRILKPGGRIAILDWRSDVEREAGPPIDLRLVASDPADRLVSCGFHEVTIVNVDRYPWLVQREKRA